MHVESHQRGVRNVKRNGEWLNMELRNVGAGRSYDVDPRRFDSRCVDLFKEFKTARANVQEVRLEPGRILTLRFVMLAVRSLFRSTEWCSAR